LSDDPEPRAREPGTIAALPALEALHRALCPGWRGILRDWFESHALARKEAKQRTIPSRLRIADGSIAPFGMPPRAPSTGADLLATLRANPADLMGEIPSGLTSEILDALARGVSRKTGGEGWTPETAVELAELGAVDSHALAKEMQRRELAKEKRQEKRDRKRRRRRRAEVSRRRFRP
jgi:hypothetical protein